MNSFLLDILLINLSWSREIYSCKQYSTNIDLINTNIYIQYDRHLKEQHQI